MAIFNSKLLVYQRVMHEVAAVVLARPVTVAAPMAPTAALQCHHEQLWHRRPCSNTCSRSLAESRLGWGKPWESDVDIDVDGYHHWDWKKNTNFERNDVLTIVLGAFKLSAGHQSFMLIPQYRIHKWILS